MLRCYKIDGDHLKQLDSLDEIDLSRDVAWIDLMAPTRQEDNEVEDFLKIPVPTREDMDEIELSARLYDEAGADYLTMLAVTQVHLEDPVKTPVTFILHRRAIVTVRYEEFISFTQYLQKAKKRNGVPMPTPQGLMLGLIESFVNRIADSLEQMGSDVDGISREVFRSKKISANVKTGLLQSAIHRIGAKGDVLSMLRESLGSISRLLLHCHLEAPDAATNKSARLKINSLHRDATSLADHASFISNKINFLLDATLGLINLEQNQIIKIFSIAAVVFLPPTLVASIYGMNFHDMPELSWEFGYPMAITLMIISGIIPVAYFKKKGWL